jgi:hypothetical protein
MKRLWPAKLLLLLLPINILAQGNNQQSKPLYASDLSSTVSGTKTTYIELIKKIIPDLQIDPNDADAAIAHRTVPFKHLSENTPAAALEGDIKLDSVEPHWIKSEGRRVLLLELDLSAEQANQGTNYEGEANVVAAFTIEPSIKLLDVMDMKTDRFTGFWEKPSVFALDPQNDAFLMNSSHSNAGENYSDLTVLFLNHDRFETITNIFLFDTQGCDATFTQTPSFSVQPGRTRRYPNVVVTVKVRKEADGPECDHPKRGYVNVYRAVYQWNVIKREYRTASKQLAALDRFNQKRL